MDNVIYEKLSVVKIEKTTHVLTINPKAKRDDIIAGLKLVPCNAIVEMTVDDEIIFVERKVV